MGDLNLLPSLQAFVFEFECSDFYSLVASMTSLGSLGIS